MTITSWKRSIQNFYLTHEFVSKLIDDYRSEKLFLNKAFYFKSKLKNLRILHVTNFNERLDGRLFFNTGRRLNNGFIRLGHSVLGFSDRDIQKYYKSLGDIKGKKSLNEKLKQTCYNYKPDLIVTGHADLISKEQIQELKEDNPNTKFAQWFLDPLNKNGPDFERNKDRILDKIGYHLQITEKVVTKRHLTLASLFHRSIGKALLNCVRGLTLKFTVLEN